MNGPRHYLEAERLMTPVTNVHDDGGTTTTTTQPTMRDLELARLHFMAAQIALTVDLDMPIDGDLHDEWLEATA